MGGFGARLVQSAPGSIGGSQSGETGAPGSTELCPAYCDEMMAQCDGTNAQYIDRQQCERICELFPQGTMSGPNADTVACRLKHALKTRYSSEGEVVVYCRQAGPGGDGACASNCEAFCTLMMSVCTEDSAGPYHFGTVEQCEASCAALPVSTLTYSTSNPLVFEGNHVQCRLFHVASGATDTREHCEHAMGVTLCNEAAQTH